MALSPVLACWSLLSFIFSEVALFIVLTSEFVMTFSLELGSLVGGLITESLVELPGAGVGAGGMIPEMIQSNSLLIILIRIKLAVKCLTKIRDQGSF